MEIGLCWKWKAEAYLLTLSKLVEPVFPGLACFGTRLGTRILLALHFLLLAFLPGLLGFFGLGLVYAPFLERLFPTPRFLTKLRRCFVRRVI